MNSSFFENGPGLVMMELKELKNNPPTFKDYARLFLILDLPESEKALLELCLNSHLTVENDRGGKDTWCVYDDSLSPQQIGQIILLRTKLLVEKGDRQKVWRWLYKLTRPTRVSLSRFSSNQPLANWYQTLGLMVGFWSSMLYLLKNVDPPHRLTNIFVTGSLPLLGLNKTSYNRRRGWFNTVRDSLGVSKESEKKPEFISAGKMVKEFIMPCLSDISMRVALHKAILKRLKEEPGLLNGPFYCQELREKLALDCSRSLPTITRYESLLEQLLDQERKFAQAGPPKTIEQLLVESDKEMRGA
ncbi:MAG: hypothetical protein KBC48_02710 [Candidatus Pacebacteria bacterium]|nr:hypothetical protein [Candidatus Paceibacterota bacterium]